MQAANQTKKKVILVIGPPGSGKGTQCEILAKKLGLTHVSIGDMVRDAIRNQTELGKLAKPFASTNSFVPDVIINDAVFERIAKDSKRGIILDGFPRNKDQALALNSRDDILQVERALILEVPDDVCMKRLLNRNAPGRNDKDEKANADRLKLYRENLKDIAEVFKGRVQLVDGNTDELIVAENIEVLVSQKPSTGKQPATIKKNPVEEEIKTNALEKPLALKKNNSAFNDVKEFKIRDEFDEQEYKKRITITAAPCEEVNEGSKDPVNVAISINAPDIETRVPIDVCCVIDISGSMGVAAQFQDPEDETRTITDGLSVLDLVKHAVKTVIHTLTEKDRLSLVTFESQSRLEYPTKYMNRKNKEAVLKVLTALPPKRSTNIWDGLKTALDSLKAGEEKAKTRRRQIVLLLTDGQPKIKPPGGEVQNLKAYLDKCPNSSFQINTFGFGNNLDSKLLWGISNVGGGVFGFIPDAKIVGTNFVNCIANAATTLCVNAKLHLKPLGGSRIAEDAAKDLPLLKKGTEYVVNIGNLQLGQSRDIVVPMHLSKGSDYLDVTLEYESQEPMHSHKIHYVANSRVVTTDAVVAHVRSHVISKAYEIITKFAEEKYDVGTKVMEELSKFAVEYDNKYENDEPRLNGLVADLVGFAGNGGRMSKAISTKERFGRWGGHYLRSIARAHQLQLRTNFMDIGLQVYGGKTFEALQNIGGKIFLELPLVKTNIVWETRQKPQPVVDNNDYYAGGGGGCFDGSCVVEVLHENGKILKTPIKNLKKGDLVCVQENQTAMFAKILAVVRIHLNERESLVEFNSSKLRLTQKHPVFYENKWQNPIDIVKQNKNIARISPPTPGTPNYVYNLVLEHTHVLKVNDTLCVALGHGIQEAYHPFYGTNAVVDVLKASKDFEKGFINVKGNIRNLISKIVEPEESRFENENSQKICI